MLVNVFFIKLIIKDLMMKRNRYVMIAILMFVVMAQICAQQTDSKKNEIAKNI